MHLSRSTAVAVGGDSAGQIRCCRCAGKAMPALLQLPSLGAVCQANLKGYFMPHAQRLCSVALLIAPPVQHAVHTWSGQILDVRKRGAAAVVCKRQWE